MRSTIRQVAQRAGVSRTTVSNVMLGRHDIVAPDKRDSVMQAVRDLQYVPVRPSLQNRHVETRVIALALDDPGKAVWGFHSGTYGGVLNGALRRGYDLLTILRPDPDWATNGREVSLLDRRSDGVIFIAPDIAERETYEALARHHIPTVVCYQGDVPDGVAWVDPDNQGAMRDAVQHLAEKGHTNIAHLTRKPQQFDFVERLRAYSSAAKDLKLSNSAGQYLFGHEDVPPDLALRVRELGVTALVCADDWLALRAWKALEAAGLRVPDDVSLIGVDNSREAEEKGLTSMGCSYAEIGIQAVDALIAQVQGRPATECSVSVPMRLHERHSVKNRCA